MNAPVFNEIIHAPNRLQICAMLSAVDSAEFAVLRDTLAVSDSVLSKHLKVLQTAGYVETAKTSGRAAERSTWISLTPAGRRALAGHLAELHRISDLANITNSG
ncbi:transcriptional regulator [Nonomuraea jiangxiensis]|uniref:Winged helix DNA-binding domain-containing protein n=1 Tax=Nonomuraea jiangxiensis TaxID=633440 RepID=A0A1G8CML5_9ACTN|nr:transcriptional regulator [Nonomuraea jiangxiensis]SDH46604.1 Winged helix DNA-binding domain-containing protein [Nonomuraea jiangxiensis]